LILSTALTMKFKLSQNSSWNSSSVDGCNLFSTLTALKSLLN
jgi:hypothetical protein